MRMKPALQRSCCIRNELLEPILRKLLFMTWLQCRRIHCYLLAILYGLPDTGVRIASIPRFRVRIDRKAVNVHTTVFNDATKVHERRNYMVQPIFGHVYRAKPGIAPTRPTNVLPSKSEEGNLNARPIVRVSYALRFDVKRHGYRHREAPTPMQSVNHPRSQRYALDCRRRTSVPAEINRRTRVATPQLEIDGTPWGSGAHLAK